MNLKQALAQKFPPEFRDNLPKAFDQIGSAAIIEIPDNMLRHKKTIAEELLKINKTIKSVYLKTGKREGKYRTRPLKFIAGKKSDVVEHKETGCTFRLNIRTCYFSPREGTERLRIASLIRPNEGVMVFFAGVGPFPIIISRKARASRIVGIELNPSAVRFFRENIRLNKVHNVTAVLGDVKSKSKKYYKQCDRVIMPLPETGYKYLSQAIRCLKPKGALHFYCFSSDKELKKWQSLVMKEAKKLRRRAKFTGMQRVLPYGPGISKMRMDFVVV